MFLGFQKLIFYGACLGRGFRQHYINHGQNIVNKFTKLSKIAFSVRCFTADLSQFSNTTVKISLLDDCLATDHQFQAFQRFS